MTNEVDNNDARQDLEYILSVISLKQLREIASLVAQVKEKKHGTVYLIVKNGELFFVDIRLSMSIRN
jgi:hypothetical protein